VAIRGANVARLAENFHGNKEAIAPRDPITGEMNEQFTGRATCDLARFWIIRATLLERFEAR